jgi:hypothetical protein
MSYSYKTTDNLVLYILIFSYLLTAEDKTKDSELKGNRQYPNLIISLLLSFPNI